MWKPSDLNSIDFRLKIVEKKQPVFSRLLQEKKGLLYVGGYPRPFAKLDLKVSCCCCCCCCCCCFVLRAAAYAKFRVLKVFLESLFGRQVGAQLNHLADYKLDVFLLAVRASRVIW